MPTRVPTISPPLIPAQTPRNSSTPPAQATGPIDSFDPSTVPAGWSQTTANGEHKKKRPPLGAEVISNDGSSGDWVEKWQHPTTPNKWVYNYTIEYIARKSELKFAKNIVFGTKLPDIRAQLQTDIHNNDTEEQVLALVVTLIDKAYFRVGNEQSDDNGVYGVTTLLDEHITVSGNTATFEYVGKKSVEQHRVVVDSTLARLLKKLKRASQNSDDHRVFRFGNNKIDSGDVNEYLDQFDVTAKEFRTFHATRLMREFLLEEISASEDSREDVVEKSFEDVAALLGHTPAVSRKSYVDPKVVEMYMDGSLR